jgi:hypothetical protein
MPRISPRINGAGAIEKGAAGQETVNDECAKQNRRRRTAGDTERQQWNERTAGGRVVGRLRCRNADDRPLAELGVVAGEALGLVVGGPRPDVAAGPGRMPTRMPISDERASVARTLLNSSRVGSRRKAPGLNQALRGCWRDSPCCGESLRELSSVPGHRMRRRPDADVACADRSMHGSRWRPRQVSRAVRLTHTPAAAGRRSG